MYRNMGVLQFEHPKDTPIGLGLNLLQRVVAFLCSPRSRGLWWLTSLGMCCTGPDSQFAQYCGLGW